MIEHILLESQLLLFAVWVMGQLSVIGLWSWRRTPATHRAVWLGLVTLPLLMLLSTAVVTRGEEISATCRTLARHVERGEIAKIGDALSGDFSAADLNRDALIERVGSAIARFKISRLRLKCFEFAFDSDNRATVEFAATCQVRTTDAYFDRVPSRWRLKLKRSHETWLITSIEAIPTSLSPVRHLSDWLRE